MSLGIVCVVDGGRHAHDLLTFLPCHRADGCWSRCGRKRRPCWNGIFEAPLDVAEWPCPGLCLGDHSLQ